MYAVDYSPVAGTYRGSSRPARQPGEAVLGTLIYKVLFAWANMQASTRKLITQRPSEKYMLGILLLSDLVFFNSRMLKGIFAAHPAGGIEVISIETGLLFLVSFVGRTALIYAFAALIGVACRIMGGRGTWRNTRIAVFWGALVAAPFGMAAALVSVAITNFEMLDPAFGATWISQSLYWLGVVPFLWFISDAVAKAQGLRRSLPLFIPMALLALVGLITAMYFRGNGFI